jgi:RimJ/RimL family protein N-acetyltransferase
MIRITSDIVTPAIRFLFHSDEMAASRCFAVLDGVINTGKIIVDNLVHPKWAIVQEPLDHDTFFGGAMDASTFSQVFVALRQEGDVLVGMPPDDSRNAYLPPDPVYDGRVVEFYNRPFGEGLDAYIRQVPADCLIHKIDRNLIMLTEWGPNDVKFWGGLELWEKTCSGYCLMRGEEILSEATVGPAANNIYEPGVFTKKNHRSKGYGTAVTARLIQEIEEKGGQTFWNCDKENLASAAIARKLGYRIEKEFRCMVWSKTD